MKKAPPSHSLRENFSSINKRKVFGVSIGGFFQKSTFGGEYRDGTGQSPFLITSFCFKQK